MFFFVFFKINVTFKIIIESILRGHNEDTGLNFNIIPLWTLVNSQIENFPRLGREYLIIWSIC